MRRAALDYITIVTYLAVCKMCNIVKSRLLIGVFGYCIGSMRWSGVSSQPPQSSVLRCALANVGRVLVSSTYILALSVEVTMYEALGCACALVRKNR